MSRTHRSCRRDHVALSGRALAAILIIAFTLSVLTSRRIEAQSDGTRQAPNREASQKVWGSAREIKDRFPADKHEHFMRRAIADSGTAGVEKRTGGWRGVIFP
jgi:hypothetical protein